MEDLFLLSLDKEFLCYLVLHLRAHKERQHKGTRYNDRGSFCACGFRGLGLVNQVINRKVNHLSKFSAIINWGTMSLKHFPCIGLGGDLPWDQTMVKLGHLYLVTLLFALGEIV